MSEPTPTSSLRIGAHVDQTDPVAEALEHLQFTLGEGPCLDAFRTGEVVKTGPLDDERAEARWPQFAPQAAAAGFDSVFAIPMRLRDTVLGSLNLFRIGPGEASDTDIAAARALADLATIPVAYFADALTLEHVFVCAFVQGVFTVFFDVAYQAYVTDPDAPRSIYEIDGARACALELHSFSKLRQFLEVTPVTDGEKGAPYHEFEDAVPQELKDAITELQAGIIDGSVSVNPADYA